MTEDPLVVRPSPSDGPLPAETIHFALGVGGTGVWCWNASRNDFVGDRGLALLWGLQGDVMSYGLFSASLHDEDRERTLHELRRAASPEGPDHCRIEFRINRRRDGSERWISLEGRRHPGAAGDPVELIGIARDVTSRKQRETHMHLLMREVTHRSKNLLAIIQAMARQTVKDSLSATEFEHRFSTRLRGLAASHDLLAARDWHGADVADLVRWQIGPTLEQMAHRISLEGPTLYLNPEAAQNIGLAVNELSSNATRFGALSIPEGKVVISWRLDPIGSEPRRFHIAWRESGGPIVTTPHRTGFGHTVVERLAARALDGEVSLSFAASGLHWSLDIPASFIVDGDTMPRVN